MSGAAAHGGQSATANNSRTLGDYQNLRGCTGVRQRILSTDNACGLKTKNKRRPECLPHPGRFVLRQANYELNRKRLGHRSKAWARTDMDYGGTRRISYDFSLVLL